MSARSVLVKEYMTAAEIALLGLKGLPGSERGISRIAKQQGWRDSSLAREREGKGGGWEYHFTQLSAFAVEQVVDLERRLAGDAKRTAVAIAASRELAETARVAAKLNARQRATMDARAALLTEIDRIVLIDACSRSQAVERMLAALAGADPTDPLAVAAASACERGRAPARSVIFDWLRQREQLGLVGLAPRPKRQKERLPAWFDRWLTFYARPAKPCISEALDKFLRTLPDPSQGPNYDQVRRALAKLGPLERAQGREGKLAMRKRLAYVARDFSGLLPSSVYVADGKTFDSEIAHPIHGRPFRPEITSIIDAGTRVCVGWSVDLDERTFGVVEALRRACAEWGIPALFYTDRGPGYVSAAMVDPLIGFLGRAHITPMKALPYNAQAKGVIERLNQLYTPFAREFPTYLGPEMDREARKVAFRTTRGELKMEGVSRTLPSWGEFVAGLIDTIARYNDRPHSELPKIKAAGRTRHMTPKEAWAAKCREGFEPIVPDAAELDDMFRPWMIRKARRGLVELFHNSYFLPALVDFDGQDVVVGYDTADASKVWVRRLDTTPEGRAPGAAIGIAVFGGNRQRYVPLTAERDAMEKRARGRLRRLDARRDEVEAELEPNRFLTIGTEASLALPLVAANDQVEATAQARPSTNPNGRPIFRTDQDYAAWLVTHPDQVGPGDAAQLRDMLNSGSFRELFRSHGLDLDALRSLARSTA